MNKKIILLILVLPLFLLLTIYTSTSSAGLNIKVPVSKIEITDSNIVYLNLDDEEKHYINYAVYPIAASNKQIIFTTEQIQGTRFAELEYKDGYIIPKTVGAAKVYLTTVDGGFKDSFIVQVESINLQAIECSVSQSNLMVGSSTKIQTSFIPQEATNKILNYFSSNNAVATVSDNGVVRAVGKGSATITVLSEANPLVKDEIVINVYNQEIMDLGQSEIYTIENSGSLNISIDTTENYQLTYSLYDTSNMPLDKTVFDEQNTSFLTLSEGQVVFNYSFIQDFKGSVILKIKITTDNPVRQPFERQCVLHKIDQIQAGFESDQPISYTAGSMFALHNQIIFNPDNLDINYQIQTSNNNIEVVEASNKIRLKAVLPGVTDVTVKIVNNAPPYQEVSLIKQVVILPTSLDIVESAETYGIENVWTVGGFEINNTTNTSKINTSYGKTEAGENFFDHFEYITNSNKVDINKDGTIVIKDKDFVGEVQVYAKFDYQGFVVKSPEFVFRAVGNGVNVRSFGDLYTATKNQKIVVLQNEIKEDFGFYKNGYAVYTEDSVTKINSTYDIDHYINLAKQNNPDKTDIEILRIAKENSNIKVLIEFKADVYGNGYQINAHNIAYGLDKTDSLKKDALFKGPRDFVSMTESQSSLVSVNAQDNISFAVYQNVTLNNVELKSCDLKADENGNYDLTDLTYVGTTVEVLGDNVNINYSRLTNGRTVLRVFGDINDSQKVINVNIKNSVLSSAREFIVRMGSNAFVKGSDQTPSPFIDEDTTKTFPMQKTYEAMTSQEKLDYENKYIKTFVNIKNSILKDSGLFCVGIDSHFSGQALASGNRLIEGLLSSWYDLAKTSYGAKLTFDGDVRMYDWKEVNKIDSSTLIEIELADDLDISDFKFANLKFDIKDLINGLANNTQKPYLNTIVYSQGENKYVHGGIAFFGGGKNYSVFEYSNYNFKALNGYEVKLSDVNKAELQLAAGNESFYFLLNDSTTQGFLPEDQANILNSSGAYSPIYIK
ncbi:MAG: Ig-like domain-containing protein [Clostridia bacterium]|nr:Ig-like domain-containing protein [Clostridia bacterium]